VSSLITRLAEGVRRHGAFQTAKAAVETFFTELAKAGTEIAQLDPSKIESSEIGKAWAETIGTPPNGFGRLIKAFGSFAALPNTAGSLSKPFSDYYGAFSVIVKNDADAVEAAIATAKTQKTAFTLLNALGSEKKPKDEPTTAEYQLAMLKASKTWFEHAAKVCSSSEVTPDGTKFLQQLVAMANLAAAKLATSANTAEVTG